MEKEKQIEQQSGVFSGNQIECGGVSVLSSTESLEDIESCVNRLLEKHKDFLLCRREFQIKTNSSYSG